jgi:hypothetical protein
MPCDAMYTYPTLLILSLLLLQRYSSLYTLWRYSDQAIAMRLGSLWIQSHDRVSNSSGTHQQYSHPIHATKPPLVIEPKNTWFAQLCYLNELRLHTEVLSKLYMMYSVIISMYNDQPHPANRNPPPDFFIIYSATFRMITIIRISTWTNVVILMSIYLI